VQPKSASGGLSVSEIRLWRLRIGPPMIGILHLILRNCGAEREYHKSKKIRVEQHTSVFFHVFLNKRDVQSAGNWWTQIPLTR